ncbi:membrane protein [Clostridium gelidum]|uniref:Membrane protein n=1 Tax=Clostridium gelidum TaxID=704125 RepID=A0ABM7T7N7_9CLOT|nr:hypothetical protein [Clostridium gelidum]BCZ47301.1 membrane protein [Clostridium gelidum]
MNSLKMLRNENLKFSQNLTHKDNEVFTDIVCYLRVSNIAEESQEEIISDILRMFLDCQENDKPIESIIGEDYKQFTDNIISAMNPKVSIINKIKEYSKIAIMGFCILLTIDFVFEYLPKIIKEGFNFNYQYPIELVTIIKFIIIIVVASAIFDYIGRSSFELSRKHFSKLSKFVLGAGFATFSIFLAFLPKLTGNIVILSVNISYIIGIIVIYWAYQGIKKIVK